MTYISGPLTSYFRVLENYQYCRYEISDTDRIMKEVHCNERHRLMPFISDLPSRIASQTESSLKFVEKIQGLSISTGMNTKSSIKFLNYSLCKISYRSLLVQFWH